MNFDENNLNLNLIHKEIIVYMYSKNFSKVFLFTNTMTLTFD
jgi:hypothetical protein